MMRDDFAIFILTHGRPHNQYTLSTLKKCNYTGKLYFIMDDDDDTYDEYAKLYGKENIVLFNKAEIQKSFDIMDNFDNDKVIIFARNASFEIAKKLNLKWFMELDDDYIELKQIIPVDNKSVTSIYCRDLDSIINAMIEYMDNCKQITSLAMSQTGDLLGGIQNDMFVKRIKRKAMNTFLCNVDRPFKFVGRINEDVNLYTQEGMRGKLFLTFVDTSIKQINTQKTSSGMTDVYRSLGTYTKSFYTVMGCPSSVKISMMIEKYQRIHHNINWNNTVPKIISSRFRKE